MSKLEPFLALLAPVLEELGRELFAKHNGDAHLAKTELRSRVEELRVARAGIDAEAERKFEKP